MSKELSDATTDEELERSAVQYALRQQYQQPPHRTYYDHLGGFTAHEMRDFNKYSRRDPLSGQQRRAYDSSQDSEDIVYLTTL